MTYYAASIDDNDPTFIYSSGWELITQDGSWTGTMHSTSVVGSVAQVRFTGSRAAAVFIIPTGDGNLSQGTFSLDNGPGVIESHACTPPVQFNTILWDSGPLPMGDHLLIITNSGDQTYLRLDRVDYDPTDSNAPSSSAAPPASSTTPAKSSPVTVTVVSSIPSQSSQSPSPSSTLGSTTSKQSGSSLSISVSTDVIFGSTSTSPLPSSATGAASSISAGDATTAANISSATESSTSSPSATLIGGILGGVLALLIIALAVGGCCLMRRRRRHHYSEQGHGMRHTSHRSQVLSTIPTPYDLNAQHPSNTQLVARVGSDPATSFDYTSTGTIASHRGTDNNIYDTFHSSRDGSTGTYHRPTYGNEPQIEGTLSSKHAEYLRATIQEVAAADSARTAEFGQTVHHDSAIALLGIRRSVDIAPPPAYQCS